MYTDNVTAYNYVKKLGGVRSRRCNQVAQEIWSWAEQNRNWISVSFVPGVLNVKADRVSRKFTDSLECALHQDIFHKMTS